MHPSTANRRKKPGPFTYTVLIVFSVLFAFPLYLAFVNALSGWYSPRSLVPTGFHIENFKYATTMIDFWHFAKNSVIICVITVTSKVLVSALTGYAFARIPAAGRDGMFLLVLSTMMVPGIVTQIPTYILFHNYGMLNTFWPWFIWGIGGDAYLIFLYRQFFSTIPRELEEAATIDGCSTLSIFWRIFLPISLPVVATASILNFQSAWGDFMAPFMFLKQENYPLATALSMIAYTPPGTKLVLESVSTAAAILFMIPVLVAFFFGQRFIVQGIVTTGIKG